VSEGAVTKVKVGGWLIIFCITLTITGPLQTLVEMINGWMISSPAFSAYPSLRAAILVECIGIATLALYGFITGCRIWAGNVNGRCLARRYLIIKLFGFWATEVIAVIIALDLPPGVVSEIIGKVVMRCIQASIAFLVWWFYFKKSKRVKSTYGMTMLEKR
jgi:hypothetical protein